MLAYDIVILPHKLSEEKERIQLSGASRRGRAGVRFLPTRDLAVDFSHQEPAGLEIALGGAEEAAESRRAGCQAGSLCPAWSYMTFKRQVESTTTAQPQSTRPRGQRLAKNTQEQGKGLGRPQRQAWEPLHSALSASPDSLPVIPLPQISTIEKEHLA